MLKSVERSVSLPRMRAIFFMKVATLIVNMFIGINVKVSFEIILSR